jgi:hypothetical protein
MLYIFWEPKAGILGKNYVWPLIGAGLGYFNLTGFGNFEQPKCEVISG